MSEEGYALFFACGGEPERPFSEEICLKAGVDYVDTFQNAEAMARVALQLKASQGDVLVKLPFAVTVETEALGAEVSFNALYGVPKVNGLRYKKLTEIKEIPPLNLQSGTVCEVLKAVRLLADRGEHVVLNIEGPFTVLGQLVSSEEIYKGLYREKERLYYLADRLSAELIRYAQAIEAAGAELISFADPLISPELVAPATYREMCGSLLHRCLQGMLQATEKVSIHLCSATSRGFEESGMCHGRELEVPAGLKYGEALCYAMSNQQSRLYGHGCLQCSQLPLREPRIFALVLEQAGQTCDYVI